ncbi:hypothetical protein, partial [Streptomyces prasinopilosus]|uniref:hypothetical protein n=1 Tax=Streptomyces prasinopilosus TaxID=67344 RepID=UPI001111F6A6
MGPAGLTVAGVEALLAGALIEEGVDAGAEQRAVAAFREAREEGAQRARTRRRDDWRPREPRPGRFPLRLTLSVLVAGLGLGGVAVAGMGAAGTATDGPRQGGVRPPAPVLTSAPPRDPSGGAPDGSSGSLPGEPSAARPSTTGPDAASLPAAPGRRGGMPRPDRWWRAGRRTVPRAGSRTSRRARPRTGPGAGR